MVDKDKQFESASEMLPEGLRRALSAADEPGFEVPEAVDAVMASTARRHFAAVRRRRILRIYAPVGAAAAMLLFVLLARPWQGPGGGGGALPQVKLAAPVGRHDITILDAFALARQLKRDAAPGPEWDFNADGVVDGGDVDALAMAAVRLEKGT